MSEDLRKSTDTKFSSLRIFWGQLRNKDRNSGEGDIMKVLKRIPFFSQLKRHELATVAQIMHVRQYREEEYIFEVGQPGAALFIVHAGEVSIEIPGHDDDDPTLLATVAKNAFFGELALLDESPRSASARAKVPSKVLALFRTDLDRLMNEQPKIAAQIYKSLATIVGTRLKATNELIERRSKKVAA